VNAIVLLPYGAHPTQCFNYYDYDVAFLNMIKEVSEEDEKFAQFLNEYVHGVNDHAEYLEKIGIGRIQSLRSEKPFGYRPGIDRAGK
jgi:glutaconate CoA-transferase subunit A